MGLILLHYNIDVQWNIFEYRYLHDNKNNIYNLKKH